MGRPIFFQFLMRFVNVHRVSLIHVFVRVIILYVILICTALFMVNIIRLLVELILGFVVVVSVGSRQIFGYVLSRLMMLVFITDIESF